MKQKLVPCPNGGKCGTKMHYIGKAAYTRCLKAAQSGGKQGTSSAATPPPAVKKDLTPRPVRGAKVLDYGETEDGFTWAVAEGPEEGLFNGYFQVGKEHPWYGLEAVDADYLSTDLDADQPGFAGRAGESTFGKDGWFGFDSLGYDDVANSSEYPLTQQISPDSDWAASWTQDRAAEEAQKWAYLAAKASGSDTDEIRQKLIEKRERDDYARGT